jgi:hypothetical protein
MPWLLMVLILLVPLSSRADEPMQLKVKPVLCIIDERTPSCEMSFVVLWESSETGYYCLYNDFEQAPLRCWSEQRSGEASDERTVDDEFRFWMAGEDKESPLAIVAVEVLRLDSGDRRRKRRGRHVWDIL